MSLRERKKAATRATLQEQAMRLFLEKGFDATTVEEIAAAANVSHMTFFRYFPTKEDAVMADEYDPFIAGAIAARPAEEPAITRVRTALRASIQRIGPEERDFVLTRARLILGTPALRARLWQQERDTADLIAGALAGEEAQSTGVRVLAAVCASAMSTAVMIWVEEDGRRDLDVILDEVFDTLQQELGR
jgi:AcrR family transcriptional regulator